MRCILVAADSPTIRRIVELTFNDTDIRVESAPNGAAALARLDAVRADLVLADVALADSSGYELCRSIKTGARPVPVLLLTGSFDPFDRRQAEDCGADGHLVKPFESSSLRERVLSILDAEPLPQGATPPPEDAAPPDAWIDRVASAVVARMSDAVVREIASEIVPRIAREMVRERIRELEATDGE